MKWTPELNEKLRISWLQSEKGKSFKEDFVMNISVCKRQRGEQTVKLRLWGKAIRQLTFRHHLNRIIRIELCPSWLQYECVTGHCQMKKET